MRKNIGTSHRLWISKSTLFSMVAIIVLVAPWVLGLFEASETIINITTVLFGGFCLLYVFKDMSFKSPALYWFILLVINIIYYTFYQSYDERATGKLYSILLVNLVFFIFYCGGKYNWISERFFLRTFYLLLFIFLIMHLQSIVLKRLDKGVDDVVVNTSYMFVYLLPFVFFIKNKTKEFCFIVFMLLMVVIGAKRGAILTYSVGVVVWFYYHFFHLQGTPRKILNRFILALLIMTALLSAAIVLLSRFSFIKDRFQGLLKGDGGSGRDLIYSNIWQGWIGAENLFNKLLGFGFSASKGFSGIEQYAHNDWLELLINFGVLGVTVYGLFWITLIRTTYKDIAARRVKFQMYSILAICLLATMISMVYSFAGPASLAICLLGFLSGKGKVKNAQ